MWWWRGGGSGWTCGVVQCSGGGGLGRCGTVRCAGVVTSPPPSDPSPELKEAVCAHFERVYGFSSCSPQMLRFLPALVPALNHMVRAAATMKRVEPFASAVAVVTPIYSPFVSCREAAKG